MCGKKKRLPEGTKETKAQKKLKPQEGRKNKQEIQLWNEKSQTQGMERGKGQKQGTNQRKHSRQEEQSEEN